MNQTNKTAAAIIGVSALASVTTLYLAKNGNKIVDNLTLRLKRFLDNAG